MNQEIINRKYKADTIQTPLEKEPLTLAVVLRGLPAELQELINFLEHSNLRTIYRKASYNNLYISDHKTEE